MYETCTLTQVENRKKLISVQIICMCNLFTVETCMYNMFTADLHTEKRNIGNESSVLGKRLRVFFTKGEKLELPPTSKSLLPQRRQFSFLAFPDFLATSLLLFVYIFNLPTCYELWVRRNFRPRFDFVLSIVPNYKTVVEKGRKD